MSTKLLTYNEVLKETENDNRHLLLGNGFSMAYNHERFSFTSLLQSAVDNGLIDVESPVYKIFQTFDTKDFEEVVKLLETSVKVLKEYGVIKKDDEKKILEDSIALKKHLVDIITNNHPEKITDVPNEEFVNSINFIKDYERIYTLNYDLLLYWTTMKLGDAIQQKLIEKSSVRLDITDGFHDPYGETTDFVVYGNDSSSQNIFYLHGALHLFDNKYEVIKNTYSRTNKTLREQTLEFLKKDIYPVFVSEGTSEQKKTKIFHNAYLNHCYKSLKGIGRPTKNDSIVVFGTMLKSNDEHIQTAVLENKTKRIYIGVSSIDKISEFEEFINKASQARYPKEVYFYDYRTALVWREI